MPNSNQKFCPNVDSRTGELDSKDYSSMANNDENTDSGSPSLSEEENNVSDKMPSERPKLVVDLNIPLQQDRNEPSEGVVNYGFEFGENRINDSATNFNDSKSPAKDKYVNESTNHRYSATLLGKVLNTSCDTEITIPDDPNMNFNKSKTRSGNAKNKESHVPEKIPLEEVHSTVVPIISDNYEKALEAQKEYSAAQNGGKDISHDVSAVNTDKLNQQNNGKRFEEYFMPANTHKKFLRGEKLYLTKEKEVATCSGWKLAVVCGSLLLIVVGVLLGVLAGVGVLVKESSIVTKGSSLPDSASMSAEAKHSNELPLSSLPITINPNHPSLQTVPKVLIVELTLANESFNDELLNNSSKDYISLVSQMRKMLANSLKNLEVNFTSVEILNTRSDSIIARFIVNLEESETSESNITEILGKYIKQKNNMVSNYHVKKVSVWLAEKFNTCLVNNGNCSHDCSWNQKNYSQTCLCPTNFILSDDSKTCLKKHLGNSKINGVTTEKTTHTPKTTTEVPTTHSPLLLVTEVVTIMPKLGPSTWTGVSDSTTTYDSSTLKNSATDSHTDAYSTKQLGTSYNRGPHEVHTYETTLSENQILELTTESRVDDASDLATLTTTSEETFGWNDNNIMVTRAHSDWPSISNLTDSVEATDIYNFDNNTSTALELVTDSHLNQPVTNSTAETNFSYSTNGKMLLTTDSMTDVDEPSTMYTNTENSTIETDKLETAPYDDILNNTVSTVTFSSSFDHITTENSEVVNLTTTTMEVETIVSETASEMFSTDSSEAYTNWNNASNITDTTISAFTDSTFTSSIDTFSQTTLAPLLLNVTNSANLNNNTSPLYVVSTESTATGHEEFSAQNSTKEQTLVELNLSVENSSETNVHTTENIEDTITSQTLRTVIASTGDESDKNVMDNPVSTTAATNYLTVNNEMTYFPEGYTNTTVNHLINTTSDQGASKNISTVEVSTNIESDVPNSTVFSEENIPIRTTTVDYTDYFNTTTNNFQTLTSTESDTITVNQTSDEIVSSSDYSTSSDFIIDRQNTSDNFHISSITEDSKSFLSSVVDPVASSEVSTTEYVQTSTAQTEENVYKTEDAIVSENDPPTNSTELPIQDFSVSTMATGIDEISCDNCTDTTSIVEQTTALPTNSTDDSKYAFKANNATLSSTGSDFGDFIVFPTNASVELNHSYSSPFMDFTTATEVTDSNTTNVEIDDSNASTVTELAYSNTTNIGINDSNTVINDLLANSTRDSTSTEIGYMPVPGDVTSDSYNESGEVELKSNSSDLSISQLNETDVVTLSLVSTENGTEVIDINIYVPNENRSLKDDKLPRDVFNRSDFEMITMDSIDSNMDYENQTDAVSMTSMNVESEETAVNETAHSNCSEGTFPCSDGSTCLDLIQLCDGINDCSDFSDENQCEKDCKLNFRCTNTSLCISALARCDDIWDCEDGSDEVGCEPTSCGVKEVMCSDGSACIKPADICNEVYNCHDKSDEVGCVERTTCDTNRFFCPEGLCIPLAQLCDAVQDCTNGEDEANCSCDGSDVFQCSNSICLPKDVFCDGRIDCQDGSDERGCVQVDIYGVVQVYDHRNQTWKLLCSDNWSEDDGNLLCQELGFSSALEVGMVPVFTILGWMERNNYTTNNSTLWTLGVQSVDFCYNDMAATVKCQEYACGGTQTQYRRKRIAEGQESGHLPGQWTSLAVLYSTESNKTCHGEVISPVWVLTSSQCLISHLPDFSDLNVRAGIINSNELVNSTQERKAQEVIIHPHSSIHRSPALRDYDVALIRIDEPFELNRYVNAICLGEEEIQEGITCFTGSFQNRKSNEEPHSSLSLSHLAVSVTDRNSCNSTAHYSKSITSRMICGQTTGSTSLCNNDDGVPLMCLSTQRKYHVAGMLSYQHNCGIYYKQPAVFSNINDMRPFIEMIVGKYRYNITYDSSLYVIVEMTESSKPSEIVSTTEFDAVTTTLETELLESTDTLPNTESTDGVILTQINNFTETAIASSAGEDIIHTTTAVTTQVYLSNETDFNQNTTTGILENSTDEALLSKQVENTDEMQDNLTPKNDEFEKDNNFSLGTTVTLNEFEVLTEIHSTIPSIQVTNDTDDYNITKERKALDYESANVDKTITISINSTEPDHPYKENDSTLLMPDNITDYNINISDVFETSLMENATELISDSVTVKSTTEISGSDLTETYIDNPITEIENLEQHTASQPHKDSMNFSQLNVSLGINEHSVKSEYLSYTTVSIANPFVTENLTRITTFPFSADVTDENVQSTYESTTMDINNPKSDKYEDFVKINDTEISSGYNDDNFSTNAKDFETTISSINNNTSTYANISSQPQFAWSSEIVTNPPVVTEFPTSSSSSEIVQTESDFKSTQEILINYTATESVLESSISAQDQDSSVIKEDFNNSTHSPNIQEQNGTYELNEAIVSVSSVLENYSTSECGIKDLENANTTWPYIGILKGSATCLASIISSKWVMTSHRCLLSGSSDNIKWTFLRGYLHSAVKNIVIHPQSEILGIDVALVELEDNLESHSSICLPKYSMTSQYLCETVTRIENVEGESSVIYIPVSAEPVMNCDISYNQLSVQHICINSVSQTCQENGMPLMCINDGGQWQLQGLSSIKTCEDNSTSIYIDVASLVPWIEESTIL